MDKKFLKRVIRITLTGVILTGLAITSTFIYFKIHPALADKNKKFTFWSIQLKPIYEKEINQIIKEFESNHPDYKVVWVDIPIQEAQKRTLASILSSTPPDLVNLNPDFSILLAQKNALHYFSKEDTEQFQQSLVDKLKYKDKIYALPFYATSPTTLYNKEVYKNCIGKKFISSYDELDFIFDKFNSCKSKPKTMALFASNLNENDTLAKILNKYDIYSLQSEIEKEKTAKLFSMFNDFYKDNGLPKDTLTINHREVIEKYMSDGTLSVVLGSNFINMVKQNAPDIYKKSALAPQLTGDNKKYDAALMNLIIPKKSKNIDLAVEFALLLTNEQNQMELAKITNVLPANKFALANDYFKNCSDDLYDKSRCLAAKQLENLIEEKDIQDNKKTKNEMLNKALEQTLLDDKSDISTIIKTVDNLSKEIKTLY